MVVVGGCGRVRRGCGEGVVSMWDCGMAWDGWCGEGVVRVWDGEWDGDCVGVGRVVWEGAARVW